MKTFIDKFEVLLLILLISGCSITVGTRPSQKYKEKNYTYHRIRRKENLFRISMYYYSTKKIEAVKKGIEKIKEANNLKDESLSVGRKLIIPETIKKQPGYALTPPEEKGIIPSSQTLKHQTIIKDKVFTWPVEGKIICSYGELGNKGIDILVIPGATVVASREGKISFTGSTSRYGETIIIEHQDNFYSIYGHDMEINVKKEDMVKKGDMIGRIKSGTQKQRYLHFEMRKGTEPLDPLVYLPVKK